VRRSDTILLLGRKNKRSSGGEDEVSGLEVTREFVPGFQSVDALTKTFELIFRERASLTLPRNMLGREPSLWEWYLPYGKSSPLSTI
jgi:hypothetical protein